VNVIKARGEARARSRGVRRCLVAVAAAAACAAALTIPAGASASTVTCGGNLAPDQSGSVPVPHALDYTFHCSEDFSAVSMTFSKSIEYFTPAPDIFVGTEPSPDDSLSCEGYFPGWGFGCHGSVGATHTVSGVVGPEKNPCPNPKRMHRGWRPIKSWIAVTTTQLDKDGNPFTTTSQPFHLYGPQCPKERRHHRHHRHG
jgi:hypothetical protein